MSCESRVTFSRCQSCSSDSFDSKDGFPSLESTAVWKAVAKLVWAAKAKEIASRQTSTKPPIPSALLQRRQQRQRLRVKHGEEGVYIFPQLQLDLVCLDKFVFRARGTEQSGEGCMMGLRALASKLCDELVFTGRTASSSSSASFASVDLRIPAKKPAKV
eukprot:TRINITY_DN35437_c0_g1_i1.p1 TRINITY_DN35437_c0_g1~~TRINITY_DN35437_c0_g1_i1.p1  ORF type:complete len:160 (+),score=19.50 TRINITY_DN35437_c0_g1_i1:55-534(+)